MMKQSATALSVLLMILVLAACKDTGGVTGTFDWDENVLVYASLSGDYVYGESVEQFNKTHTDVQIEVRDYSDEGGLSRLTTEILAGKIPDIIDLQQMPYRQLAQGGYLEDLWPYIESDPELGRGAVMEVPLRAAEINGGLYMAFRSVLINTLIGAERLTGSRYSWSMEELLDAFATMPEDSTITDYYATKSMIFNMMCAMSLDSYVDWNTGKCSFDSESFRGVLEFVDSFPYEYDWSPEEGGLAELRERRRSGRQMLWMTGFYQLSQIPFLDDLYAGKTAFIGYPVGDGTTGSSFDAASRTLAISSVCRNKAAAWEYLRDMFLPRYTRKGMKSALESGSFYGFPVNRADHELMLELSTDPDTEYKTTGSSGDEINLYPISQEDAARFVDFYNSVGKFDESDRKMMEVVYDACGPYFAGDKGLDETVELIQNRMTLYVNERR